MDGASAMTRRSVDLGTTGMGNLIRRIEDSWEMRLARVAESLQKWVGTRNSAIHGLRHQRRVSDAVAVLDEAVRRLDDAVAAHLNCPFHSASRVAALIEDRLASVLEASSRLDELLGETAPPKAA